MSVLALGLVAPAPAQAATGSAISLDAGEYAMTYTAGPGQANRTTVSATTQALTGNATRWTWTVSDVAPIRPGDNCSIPDPSKPNTAQCTVIETEFADFYPQHQFYLGDGADQIDFSAADAAPRHLGGTASIHGGPGNDVLTATGDEYLSGDAGNDRIDGRAGPDTILGGEGNDYLLGGMGNDTIYGNSGADRIFGNSGNDQISGGPGSDTISGGPGTDSIKP